MESYEEFLELKKSGGKTSSKIISGALAKLELIHVFLLIILILFLNNLVKKGGDNKWVFIGVGILILLWIFSLVDKTQERKPIPRHIAEKIALKDLNNLVDIDSSYPHGTKVIHTGVFKAHHMDSGDPNGWGLDKYNFGFKIIRPGKSTRFMIYQMNPYPPGESKGIISTNTEWQGDDVKDFQIIIPEKTIIEEKKS